MRKQIIWSVLCNGLPYEWRRTKKEAEALATSYRKNSPHKWTVQEQRVRKRP